MGESLGCMSVQWHYRNCMDSSFLRSAQVRFGDLVFNWFAVDNWDLINLGKGICIVFWPDICATFSIASIQASNLLIVPLHVSIYIMAAFIIVCSIIPRAYELPSKVVGLMFLWCLWVIFIIVMCVKYIIGMLKWIAVVKPITWTGWPPIVKVSLIMACM